MGKAAAPRDWFTASRFAPQGMDYVAAVALPTREERDELVAQWIMDDPTCGPLIRTGGLWATEDGARRWEASCAEPWADVIERWANRSQ